jgi:hypothetical protein
VEFLEILEHNFFSGLREQSVVVHQGVESTVCLLVEVVAGGEAKDLPIGECIMLQEVSVEAVAKVVEEMFAEDECVVVVEMAIDAEIECFWECAFLSKGGAHAGVSVPEGIAGLCGCFGVGEVEEVIFWFFKIFFKHLASLLI